MANTPTPEELKAMAAAKAAAEAKASAATAPTVSEVSGGLVNPAPQADAVSRGAAGMDEYASPADRKAQFKAAKDAKDTRFTMPNEPERGLVPYSGPERGIVPYAAPSTSTAGPMASEPELSWGQKMGKNAGESWKANRGAILKGAGVNAALIGGQILNEAAPRSDNSTWYGKASNIARDVAGDAAIGYQTGEVAGLPLGMVPRFGKTLRAGAAGAGALVGTGVGIYDAAKKALQGGYNAPGDTTSLVDPAEKSPVYSYLSGNNTPTDRYAGVLRAATQGPVSQLNADDLRATVETPLNLAPNVKQEADGSYTKSIYDDQGKYLGYGNQKSPYATADQALKQELTPQAQALYERNKAIMDSRISNNPPVMTVSPSGNAVQTNYDANGDIVRNQNPEVQQRVQDILRNRAVAAQAQMPEFEAGNVQRHDNYLKGISNSSDPNIVKSEANRQAQYNAAQQMERASAPRMTGDPLRDAPITANITNAAKGQAIANGEDPANPNIIAKYLPKENGVGALGSNASTNDLAMQTLRGTSMPSLINRAITQNFGGSRTDDAENKRAIDQISKQATIDQKDESASASAERLELAKQTAQNALDARSAATGALRIKGLEGRLDRIDKEILTNTTDLGDIAKKKGAALNLKALEAKRAKIQASLDKESGLEPEETKEAPAVDTAETKQIGGVTYTKINGEWHKI